MVELAGSLAHPSPIAPWPTLPITDSGSFADSTRGFSRNSWSGWDCSLHAGDTLRWWRTEPLADTLVRPSLDTWVRFFCSYTHWFYILVCQLPLEPLPLEASTKDLSLFLLYLLIIKVKQPPLHLNTRKASTHKPWDILLSF